MGRKFDQIKINDPNDKLHYVVTPPSPASSSVSHPRSAVTRPSQIEMMTEDTWSQQTSTSTNDLSTFQPSESSREVAPTVKRRVSRVESLRNLFFSSKNGQTVDARRRFLLKKRTRSEEKEKVRMSTHGFKLRYFAYQGQNVQCHCL